MSNRDAKGRIVNGLEEGNTFSSTNQPGNRGRKPNVRAWKDVLADMMPEEGYLQFKDVQEVDADGNLERIEWRYTKEHPNGKPDWAQKKDAFGKIVWDNTEETAFFLRKLEVFRERLSATRHKEMSASVFTDDDFPSASDEPYFPPEEGYDDLPY